MRGITPRSQSKSRSQLWRMSAHYSSNLNIQVPGAQDGSVTNSPLLPQQDCPAFAGDAVLNGAFKKISNAVDLNILGGYKKSWELGTMSSFFWITIWKGIFLLRNMSLWLLILLISYKPLWIFDYFLKSYISCRPGTEDILLSCFIQWTGLLSAPLRLWSSLTCLRSSRWSIIKCCCVFLT